MWRKCTHTLALLTQLYSMRVKLKLTGVENNAFIDMKKILGRDVLISYPNFSNNFIIHTDAIKTQLGGVISHNSGKPSLFNNSN